MPIDMGVAVRSNHGQMRGNLQLRNNGKPDPVTGEYIWRLRIYLGRDGDGKQQFASRTFRWKPPSDRSTSTGKDQAETELAEFLADVRQDRVDTNRKLFSTLAEQWLAAEVAHGLSPTTLRSYRNVLKQKLLPQFGKRPASSITSFDLDNFYAAELRREVRGHPIAPATVVKYHRILSSIFRQAERWGWIQHSPTRNARAPKLPNKENVSPDLDVVRKIVEAAPDDRMRLFMLLAASIGARRGEIVGLKWEDIDFVAGVVSIPRSAYEKEGGGVGIKSTKSDKPRKVSLDARILQTLDAIKGTGFIFTDNGKDPWRPDHVTKTFADIREKVPEAVGVRLHDLRHYHATTLIAAGIDVVTVSKRLGHAKVSTTLDIYTSAVAQRDRDAALVIHELGLDEAMPIGIPSEALTPHS